MQGHETTQKQKWFGRRAGGGEFAGARVEFQNLAFDRRGDAAAGDLGFTCFGGRVRLGDASPKRPDAEAAPVELIEADDFLPGWFSRSANSATATASAAR